MADQALAFLLFWQHPVGVLHLMGQNRTLIFLKHTTHSTQELTQLIPCSSTERAPVHVGYSPGVLDLAHHYCLHWCLYSLWKYMHKWALESWRSQLFCIAPSSFPCLTDTGLVTCKSLFRSAKNTELQDVFRLHGCKKIISSEVVEKWKRREKHYENDNRIYWGKKATTDSFLTSVQKDRP